MARTGYIDAPDNLQVLLANLLQYSNRYINAGVRKKSGIIPEKKKYNVPSRSFLPAVAEMWNALTEPEREAWKTAAGQTNLNGWNLFVQDTCYRMKYGYTGLAVPSNYHQYKVGRLQIEAPASKLVISQSHPIEWYKLKKVTGTKNQYHEVSVTERLMLPLTLGLSYRSDLTAAGDTPIAKFYAKVISHYQGRDIETTAGFDIDLSTDWTRETTTLTEVLGVARWYDLFIELRDVRGYVEFDNVLASHTGSNYARDFRCNDIDTPISRTFFQVTKSWEAIEVPTGSDFESVYPAD